jgi:hypothetical protein
MVFRRFRIPVSVETVRITRIQLRILYRPARKQPHLEEDKKDLRVVCCRTILQLMALPVTDPRYLDPKDIAWTDESICELGSDGLYVRYRRGEWNLTATSDCAKFPAKIMVFGGIKYDGSRFLVRIKGSVDASKYVDIVDEADFVNAFD